METFLYQVLNISAREMDKSKVITLSPLAVVVSTILRMSEQMREQNENQNVMNKEEHKSLYRGLLLDAGQIEAYVKSISGRGINLSGHTSTTTDKYKALN